jgi:hypothetical protein
MGSFYNPEISHRPEPQQDRVCAPASWSAVILHRFVNTAPSQSASRRKGGRTGALQNLAAIRALHE